MLAQPWIRSSRPVVGGEVSLVRSGVELSSRSDATTAGRAVDPRACREVRRPPTHGAAGARRGGAAAAQGLPGATRPAIDPFAAVIDGWLLADHDAPRKQRHTAR